MRQTTTLQGRSTAGIGTALIAPSLGIAFDLGTNLRNAEQPHALITHAHADHVGGFPLFVERCAMRRVMPTIYASQAVVEDAIRPMERMQEAVTRRQNPGGRPPTHQVQVVAPDVAFPLSENGVLPSPGRRLMVIPLRADHVVPCQGYLVLREYTRLNPAFAGLSPAEIVNARRQGHDVNQIRFRALCGYSGDTTERFFDLNRALFESEIEFAGCELAVEASYLGANSDERASQWGHMSGEQFLRGFASIAHTGIVPVPVHLSTRTTEEERTSFMARVADLGGATLSEAEPV
jgi:ribonuclease BN (tRNA processing enzyme)